MLWSRSASLIRITRRSRAIEKSILRKFSACSRSGRSAAGRRGAVPGGRRGPKSWLPDLDVAQLELEPRSVLPDVDRRDECDRYPAHVRLNRAGEMPHPEPDAVDLAAVLPEAQFEV